MKCGVSVAPAWFAEQFSSIQLFVQTFEKSLTCVHIYCTLYYTLYFIIISIYYYFLIFFSFFSLSLCCLFFQQYIYRRLYSIVKEVSATSNHSLRKVNANVWIRANSCMDWNDRSTNHLHLHRLTKLLIIY
jgi:hypothetical protein